MKEIPPTNRVSFSTEKRPDGSEETILCFNIPEAWTALDDRELREIYRLKTKVKGTDFALRAFLILTSGELLRRETHFSLFTFRTQRGYVVRSIKPRFLIPMLEKLKFLETPGDDPVRVDELHKCKAADRKLHGFPFSEWIRIEQAWQAFLKIRDRSILERIAASLYPVAGGHLAEWEAINIIGWMAALKAMFTREFPNFYRPAGSTDGDPMSMRQQMDVQIRALTGGDVTKERQVLATDVWRALTELDAKAKEAADIKRERSKTTRR